MIPRISVALLCLFLFACDTAEERAQKHFENATELLEAGDIERGVLELRNALKLNDRHRDARIAFAEVLLDAGNQPDGYKQYARLVELYPEDMEGRRAAAELAAELNDWDAVERHVEVALRLAPADVRVQAVKANLDYRTAVTNRDSETGRLAVDVSHALLDQDPSLRASWRVVIDDLLRRKQWNDALEAIDEARGKIEADNLMFLRLGVLQELGMNAAIVDQLKEMVEAYPDEGFHAMLVSRYVDEDRIDEAEAYLRERADRLGGEDVQPIIELITVIAQHKGLDTAVSELDGFLTEGAPHRNLLTAFRASLRFDMGEQDEAILTMEDILAGQEPSEEINRIKIDLAKMLIRTDNVVGARARVEEVLAHDASNVEAIKLKASWLIEDDKPGDALVDLRTALDQSPRDAELMTLMARAHQRNGDRELMGEMLSLAVDAANSAPRESLEFAAFLSADQKYLVAEEVLITALRIRPDHPAILTALGELYLRLKDWPRAQDVIETLQRLGGEDNTTAANELTARLLAARNQAEDLEEFLLGLTDGQTGLAADASIIRLRLSQGDVEGAAAFARGLLEGDPTNPALRFLNSGVLIASGQFDEAEEALRLLVNDLPQSEQIWLSLFRLQREQGKADQAAATLAEAQEALPDSLNIKWIAAGEAETAGKIDEAIALYEDMYAANSNSTVIANNLASLISSYREDTESLERAYAIARRLRDTDEPAFQDTYGWIAHRLGNHDEALRYLRPAAEQLPDNALVQFHLAETLNALGRRDEALAKYREVVELSAELPVEPQFLGQAMTAIETLSAGE